MSYQSTLPMALMQPTQATIVEEFYDKDEPILPKQDGEFTFFLMQPIYKKGMTAFRAQLSGPDSWNTDHFQPGAPAPGDCVVLWNKVVRQSPLMKPKTPPLIT